MCLSVLQHVTFHSEQLAALVTLEHVDLWVRQQVLIEIRFFGEFLIAHKTFVL